MREYITKPSSFFLCFNILDRVRPYLQYTDIPNLWRKKGPTGQYVSAKSRLTITSGLEKLKVWWTASSTTTLKPHKLQFNQKPSGRGGAVPPTWNSPFSSLVGIYTIEYHFTLVLLIFLSLLTHPFKHLNVLHCFPSRIKRHPSALAFCLSRLLPVLSSLFHKHSSQKLCLQWKTPLQFHM